MMHTYQHNQSARAFSLTEILIAIFILGIGVLGIAAIFPAGIAQQRQSMDDLMGPIVANHAMSVIHAKVPLSNFGETTTFGLNSSPNAPTYGDWGWTRPGIIRVNSLNAPFDTITDHFDTRGTIDVFSAVYAANQNGGNSLTEFPGGVPGTSSSLYGVPYSTGSPPIRLISQHERYYPNARVSYAVDTTVEPPDNSILPPTLDFNETPQYVWDCMFRRWNGQLQVAIIVYRVFEPGGGDVHFAPITDPAGNGQPLVPWPIEVEMTADAALNAYYPLNVNASNLPLLNRNPQWALDDRSGSVHRIIGVDREAGTQQIIGFELDRPLPPLNVGFGTNQRTLWVIPAELPLGGNLDVALRPVFITVRNLS